MASTVKPFHLLINSKSGTVLKTGVDALRKLVATSGIPVRSFNLIEPEHIVTQFDDFAADDHFVLLGGGDGTVASCLPYFIKTGRALGVLPLGTMNLLAKDLGFSGDLATALTQYTQPMKRIKIDVAYVNDHPFLCCAGLGTMPESAVFRENMRGENDLVLYPKLIKFIFDQMDPAMHRRVSIHMDGRKRRMRTAAIVVSNNLFANHPETANDILRRNSLSGGQLGIYSFAPQNLIDKLGLIARLRFGSWKHSARLREWHARDVLIDDPERKELVSIDGEVKELSMPLHFRIEPQALSVIVPEKPHQEKRHGTKKRAV